MTTVGLGISEQQSASVSLGENTGALTPAERQRVNRQVGGTIDKKLGASVRTAFGLSLDASRLVALTGALKTSVRSKLSASLGITKETGAGAGGGVSFGGVGGVGGTQASLGTILGLKAGGTTTAGDAGTPLAGVTLAAGADPKGIPGLTAGVIVIDPESAQIQVSASRELQAELDLMLTDSLEHSGLSPQKQEAVKSELQPQLNKALEDTFRSSFGPAPDFPHAMGVRILGCEVRMPRTREWTAIVSIDQEEPDAEPPTGPFSFEIERIEFRCSVIPGRSGRSQGGRTTLRVVGGAGGLEHGLEVRNYAATSVKTVVDDIMRDSGETLSAEADAEILAKRLPSWQRVEGHGRLALDLLCEKLVATWRVLRDGTVWIGVDQWPEVEPDGTVQDDDWGDGSILVAPDTPTMVPGVVVRGQRVEEVFHRLDAKGLRTELRSVGVRSAIGRALDPIRHATEYTKRYRCKVVSQGGDGRVDVLVDDERMKGRGVAKCAVRVGIPGTTVDVPAGARCLVGWDDGDPALPYVDSWERGTGSTQISVDGGTAGALGVGAMVRIVLPFTPTPAPGPLVPFPLFGFVEGPGNAKLKV